MPRPLMRPPLAESGSLAVRLECVGLASRTVMVCAPAEPPASTTARRAAAIVRPGYGVPPRVTMSPGLALDDRVHRARRRFETCHRAGEPALRRPREDPPVVVDARLQV